MLITRILHSSLVFQHVIENMHDGVLTIDHSGIISTVNPAALEILGMKKDQVADKKLSEVFFKYPENDDFNQIIIDAVYDASVSHHRICSYYTGKTLKSLFVTTSFLKVEINGEVQSIGVTVLFSDISELQELRDAAAALDKIKDLNRKLERLSYLDDLTNLPNRRFFNDTCNREWFRAMREQKSIAFIMIDVDYFKELNDRQGHQAGDETLVNIAKTLKKPLKRSSDLVARYGGDEFIAILPNSDLSVARTIAEAMRSGIFDVNIENPSSPFGRITVSIGIAAAVPERQTYWKELFKSVDEALYRAKEKGRNQVSD